MSRSPGEFRQAGIDVRTRSEVVDIDLGDRTVRVRDLDAANEYVVGFDRLVYATGAEPTLPDVAGAELCAPVRTVDAAERFRTRLEHSEAAAGLDVGDTGALRVDDHQRWTRC